jgi:hypothetical protein
LRPTEVVVPPFLSISGKVFGVPQVRRCVLEVVGTRDAQLSESCNISVKLFRCYGYVFLGVIDVVIRVFYFRFSSWGTDIEVCDLVLGRKFFLY